MLPAALDDIKILDISQGISGSYCAKLLADFGADVIKVEPPGGELLRSMGPFFNDDPHPEKSLIHVVLNNNKRGVTLNLETSSGARLLKRLVEGADVVIENYQPGYLESLGLGFQELEKVNPQVILTSISGFGQSGPYSDYKSEDIVAYAMGGIMAFSGTRDREPLKHGGFQSQYEAGLNAAIATGFALFARDFDGESQHIDVSVQEAVNASLVVNQPLFSFSGAVQGRRSPKGTMYTQIMPCKDGYFVSQTGARATWDDQVRFYGKPEMAEERFANPVQRLDHGEEFDAIIVDAVKDRTMKEMFKTASEEYGMLFGISQGPEDLMDCPQLAAREFYQDVDHPVIGKTKIPFRLFHISETPFQQKMPAPLLGQHNEEVYTETMGYSKEDIIRLRELNII